MKMYTKYTDICYNDIEVKFRNAADICWPRFLMGLPWAVLNIIEYYAG